MKSFCLILATILCLAFMQAGPENAVGTDIRSGNAAGAAGNDTAEPKMDCPIWQFCHAKSADGLDTAVITHFITDCEAGPIPAEDDTAENLEEIRQLALHGAITGLVNQTMVTGGTHLYSFESPDGTFLMAIEMYKGLIVGPDGMYSFAVQAGK